MANRGGKTIHELNVRTKLAAINTAQDADEAQPGGGSYTECYYSVLEDLSSTGTFIWESHPTLRSRIKAIVFFDFTTAIANSPTISVGASGGDVDAQVAVFTLGALAANSNDVTDRDASAEAVPLVDGILPVAAASQLMVLDIIDPGTGTGIGTFVVVVEYFV